MNLGLAGRTALVTGAGRNIGRAIAVALAREGARVVLVSRSQTSLDDACNEIAATGGKGIGIAMDLQQPGAPERLYQDLLDRMDDYCRPQILVHNLGGSLGVTDPFAPSSDWAKVWQFNVGIAHDLNRLFLPAMIESRWGRVLHLSTLSTRTHDGYAAYVAAKCALDGYVSNMARHVSRHNIVMNALAPGLIRLEGRYFARMQTENPTLLEQYYDNHLPIRRMGDPNEIAAIAAFLCSEHAAFMPGSIVRADGGGG